MAAWMRAPNSIFVLRNISFGHSLAWGNSSQMLPPEDSHSDLTSTVGVLIIRDESPAVPLPSPSDLTVVKHSPLSVLFPFLLSVKHTQFRIPHCVRWKLKAEYRKGISSLPLGFLKRWQHSSDDAVRKPKDESSLRAASSFQETRHSSRPCLFCVSLVENNWWNNSRSDETAKCCELGGRRNY